MDHVPGSIMDVCVHTCTQANSTQMHVHVCLLPPLVLPWSVLKHAPRPRLPGQPEANVPAGGWGGGAKGNGAACPHQLGAWSPIWVTDRRKNQMALFPPSLLFLGLRWSSTSRENTLARGAGFRAPSGRLAFAEHWVNYLERKTEDKEVVMVAWACTLVPLPHLGTHFQKAIGSVLTVFFVDFETRPMGK